MNKTSANKKNTLTERQQEILGCILKGMNNHQISSELNISYGTAKLMSFRTLQKLGLSSKNEAMAKFLT